MFSESFARFYTAVIYTTPCSRTIDVTQGTYILNKSVPLVGYPQRYGKRGSTLASTSVVLHGDEKSAGVLPKGTFSPGWLISGIGGRALLA